MEFSASDLETIEFMGNQLREPVAIARVLGISPPDFDLEVKDRKSPAYAAYWKGREMRVTALHKVTLDAALEGSTPAIEKALEILKRLV